VVSLEFEDASSDAVDWVLLGTGRLACTSGLRLDAAGVAVDDGGFIMVDRHCRTSCPSVFAIGDVVNAHMSANRALHDAAIAIANIASPGSRIRDANSVPDVIYSAVEMARVGLNEDDAEARGVEPASGFSAFESNPAAAAEHDTDGFVRIVADMDTGRLLGGEVVGRNAGDTIQLIANAIGQDDALRELARASYNHPARGEEVLNAVEALASRWGLGRFVFGGARER
jgi:dihydrolipoamide dehydrogenase